MIFLGLLGASAHMSQVSRQWQGPVGWEEWFPIPQQRGHMGAAEDLIKRLLGNLAGRFVVETLPATDAPLDTMQLASKGNSIVLRGSSPIAVASALNWYLNDYLNTTYDWNTYELQIPSTLPLPDPAGTAIRRRTVPYSYYLNVCTLGYSLAFVDYAYWEKHLDWMALQGINLPLAFIGQEWVWVEVFKDYNITLDELQEWFTGPAFLPWFRMGNLRGWAGPLTVNWINQRKELQVKLLARMRELGMIPVLPAFAGHIPEAIAQKFPHANITRSANWVGFPEKYARMYLLEATDPLYTELGNKFIKKQSDVYGTDHIYNCDTFNEMRPRSSDPTYLKQAAAAVYNGMVGADPKAIWLMQGWLFFNEADFWKPPQVEAYLSGVANTSMWILDLYAEYKAVWETTKSFYGKPFIWCTLLNFGGQQGLFGNLSNIVSRVDQVMTAASQGAGTTNLLGVGITMEGIWQNYPVFELTLQTGWNAPKSVNVNNWVERYGTRRYGSTVSPAVEAWKTLGQTIYAGIGGGFGSIISRVPVPPGLSSKTWTLTASPACAFSNLLAGMYLKDYPPGYDPAKPPHANTLIDAQTWCNTTYGCGGITLHLGRYEARMGTMPMASPTGESSWVKLCQSPAVQAFTALLNASQLASVASYNFDLVDLGREVVTSKFVEGYSEWMGAVKNKDVAGSAKLGERLLQTLDDLDRLLSTNVHFMLGPFIEAAKSWGADSTEKALMEFNARNQLTLWGPAGEINDYAAKSWGGLVKSYYKPRWALLITRINEALSSGSAFDAATYRRDLLKQEQAWQTELTPFPVHPVEDTVQVAKYIADNYAK